MRVLLVPPQAQAALGGCSGGTHDVPSSACCLPAAPCPAPLLALPPAGAPRLRSTPPGWRWTTLTGGQA